MIRKIVIASMLAASFASIATPAAAVVYVQVAPPEPRVEVVPAPRANHVWVAGHWEWRNNKHHWVKGAWIRDRHGYQYVQPTWVQHDGRWTMQQGNWHRNDSDGDGVPNQKDRAPNNPNRS